ncbi:MAG: EVE domain-containing protein [Oscillatoria princeps RMCB-10]|jgi:predicted RNA-binding protein with PUA-like domain|nr:EVE domain-containing protein [Oscillatoria princeps RMCB-10]
MAYWLLKSEPQDYSYAQLETDGTGIWDGVSNPLALKHLRATLPGDLALFYHTGSQRQVVGIAELISPPYPDPNLNDPKRVVVDVRPVRRLPQPVTLTQMKANGHFEGFDLLRLSRLSVVPVSPEHWRRILYLAGEWQSGQFYH